MGGPIPIRARVLSRSLVVLGLTIGVSITCESATISWSALLLRREAPQWAAFAGLGAAFFFACQATFRVNADALRSHAADRTMMLLSFLFAAAGLGLVAVHLGFATSVVGFAIVGIGTAADRPLRVRAGGRATPRFRRRCDLGGCFLRRLPAAAGAARHRRDRERFFAFDGILLPGGAASRRVRGGARLHSGAASSARTRSRPFPAEAVVMKSHTRVAVIGGGVVGASVAYHLTKGGWKDVVLIERSELTSGSTWHAAGGMHTLNGDPNVAKLQQYTINLYKEIEAISGVSCGMHVTGGLNLAGTKERLDWLKMARARGRYLGMNLEIISIDEAARMYPFIDKKHFVGAMFDPVEGHLDPWGVTQAYAKCATMAGAEINRFNRVVDLKARPDGAWDVFTEKGNIVAEHVVNCGGLWAREVGRMVGLELPILAMEHHYLITEDIPGVIDPKVDKFHVIDFEGEIYMRQEGGGMLIGTYEQACQPWSERETPWDFGQNLLPNDLDRIAPSLETAFEHFPDLGKAGIRKVVNGPFTFAPDGNPLIGPVKGLKNFWVACGVMAGFSQGGGVGLALANWMIDGDPGHDVWGMDVARFGDWATLPYTNAKVRENYSRRFRIRFPNEELPAARPLRTTPIYDRLVAENAVFGEYCGLENPLWFAPKGVEPREDVTFRRSNALRPCRRGMPRRARTASA